MRLTILVVLVTVASTGCAITTNTMLVGSQRARREVDTVVCVESSPGVCRETLEVGRHAPARAFGGGGFVPTVGYAHVDGAPGSHRAIVGAHGEYLRGRGAIALGARAGVNSHAGDGETLWTVPVTVLGYWGVPARSVFAGGGYTPYARVEGSTETQHGPNALLGARLVLWSARGGERVTTSIELTYTSLGPIDIVTACLGFGLHL